MHPIPLVKLRNIAKSFPGVKALDGVDFELEAGELHALMGENGAGKSTLMKILTGIHKPDSGAIEIDGEVVEFASPQDARQAGIALVHQELSLIPELSVAENIFLGALPTRRGVVLHQRLFHQAGQVLDRLGCEFSPKEKVRNLSIAQQQMVEIARALAGEARVVVFDEPTSSLNDHEKHTLYAQIRRLKRQGVGMVYISHRMDEIFALSERMTVLRDGRHTATLQTSETDRNAVTRMMIGRDVAEASRTVGNFGGVELSVKSLSCRGLFQDINFEVRSGEVLGFYGLVGAGRSELAETLFGLRKADSGEILVSGKSLPPGDPRAALKSGMVLLPEDRKQQGLLLDMTIAENLSLLALEQTHPCAWLRKANERIIYESQGQRLRLKAHGPDQRVGDLSGGNQQKVLLGRSLEVRPRLLILDEPTRGIDVGSKAEIHRLIDELAQSGLAIVVISSEMPEVMGVSHRVLTMCDGELSGAFDGASVTEEELVQHVTPA